MSKYLVLYHADVSAEQQMEQSPEEGQAEMQEWMAWAEGAGQAIVDLGTPLGNGRTVGGSGAAAPSTVAGYSILEAANADAAAALMQGHPHLKTGTIEVLESIEVPGM